MRTLHSIAGSGPQGPVIFDFVVSGERAGWFRHGFERSGNYASAGPAGVDDIRHELGLRAPATFVIELRAAASALERSVGELLDSAEAAALEGRPDEADRLAARAGEVERHRLRALDEVLAACDAAWDARL